MKARLILLFAVIASVVATVAAPVANAGTLVGPSMPASVTCNSAGRQLFIAPQVGAGTAFASEGIAFKVYYYWRASRSNPWTGKVLLVGGQEWTSFTHYREWSYSDPITGANLVSYTKYASPVPEVRFLPQLLANTRCSSCTPGNSSQEVGCTRHHGSKPLSTPGLTIRGRMPNAGSESRHISRNRTFQPEPRRCGAPGHFGAGRLLAAPVRTSVSGGRDSSGDDV